jgi:ATP-dependent protease Clp ATPase subunit
VLGPDHPNTSTSRNNLAGACQAVRKILEGEKAQVPPRDGVTMRAVQQPIVSADSSVRCRHLSYLSRHLAV